MGRKETNFAHAAAMRDQTSAEVLPFSVNWVPSYFKTSEARTIGILCSNDVAVARW